MILRKLFFLRLSFSNPEVFLSSDIPRLISGCPTILCRSLTNQLIPSFDFFRNLFQSDDKFNKVIKDFSGILLDINAGAVPNMKLLREEGVPELNVIKLLQYYPRTLTKNHCQFKEIVEEVKEMAFDPLMLKFVIAVYALTSLSKCMREKKAHVYKKWGWSDNDIVEAFKRFPFCMNVSEDKIDAVMEFLVNKWGCESSTIARYPGVLSMSLNKRIVPRASVFEVLLSKGQVKKESLLIIFTYSERLFLKRFIMRHEKEASDLLNLYEAKLDIAG